MQSDSVPEDTGPATPQNIKKKRLVLHPPKVDEPDGETCVLCFDGNENGMVACARCDSFAYCSLECRAKHRVPYCSHFCKTFSEASQSSQGEGLLSGDELAMLADPRNYEGRTDDSSDEEETCSMSAEELEAQKQALRGIEQRRLQNRYHSYSVVGWKFVTRGRELEYELKDKETNIRIFVNAVDLHGPDWTEKLEHYWKANRKTWKTYHMPHGRRQSQPVSGKRSIIGARFEAFRDIKLHIQIRDAEGDEKTWEHAMDLNDVWDELIPAFWQNCRDRLRTFKESSRWWRADSGTSVDGEHQTSKPENHGPSNVSGSMLLEGVPLIEKIHQAILESGHAGKDS